MASGMRETNSESPIDPFSELTWDDLNEWAGSRIVARGRSYQRKGAVRDLQRDDEGALVAWVAGSGLYAVRVSVDGSKNLISECTCPYWTTCKHAVAVVVEYLEIAKKGTVVGRVEADDPRLEELYAITENEDEPMEFDAEDLDKASVEAVSKNSGSGQSPDTTLRTYIQEHTKAELVELLLELAETHDEVRQSLENRRSLTSGETRKVLKRIRSEIAALEEPAWESHHYGGYQMRNTDRLKAMLQALVASGQADAAVRLGPELLAAGTQALEYEHEAESTEPIGACLDVLFHALDRSSLTPADRIEWVLDMALADEYELCGEGFENLWNKGYAKSDWSEACDRLTKLLDDREQPAGDDERSSDYKRDSIADWLIHALEKAGRRNEIVPLCKREAPITFGYHRLVDRLMAERAWDDARHWCRKGLEAMRDRYPGLRAKLREQLQTINRRSGNPLAGLALQAEEFFNAPSSNGFQALCGAARELGVSEGVDAWGRHFLQTGRRPQSGRKRKSDPELKWPLPAPEIEIPAQRGEIEPPMVDVLIRLAIDEKKPNEVLKWYDHPGRTKGTSWMYDVTFDDDDVADAIVSTHPDRAVAIWKHMAEEEIAQVKPKAYEDAVPYLLRVRDVLNGSGREEEWQTYLADLRQQNRRRPRCLEQLDRLEGGRRRILDG